MSPRLCSFCLLYCTLLSSVKLAQQEEILMLTPLASKSHKNVFTPIAEALAEKGHQVTLVSSYKPSQTITNVTEIAITELEPIFNELKQLAAALKETGFSLEVFRKSVDISRRGCTLIFDTGILQNWIKTKPFKVVLVDAVMNECLLPLAEHMAESVINLNTATLFPWIAPAHNCPQPYSYIPNQMMNLTSHMTFFQRLSNLLSYLVTETLQKLIIFPAVDDVVQSRFPGVKTLWEAMQSSSFVLINADPVFNIPRPYTPNMADFGGIHCRPAKPLPKDLEEFVSTSGDDGFVIFSLGSIHDGRLMTPKMRDELIGAFSRLKQKVIWKHEEDVEGLPSNIKVVKWLPQQDLLGHPKVRAFITHSGLLSLQEAIYHGVPTVSIPLFADQPNNVAIAHELGLTIPIDWDTLTSDQLYHAVQTVMNEPSYKENVEKNAKIFKDRPKSPRETVVYWIEYVMRHNGARHFRSPAQHLNFFQYFLLDVIGVTLLGLIAVTVGLTMALKKIITHFSVVKQKKQ